MTRVSKLDQHIYAMLSDMGLHRASFRQAGGDFKMR